MINDQRSMINGGCAESRVLRQSLTRKLETFASAAARRWLNFE
jgi:hypothetical protein